MFGALDPEKLLAVLALALIVMGPDRLPKAARQLGSYWRAFVDLHGRLEDEVRSAMPDLREALPDAGDLPRLPKHPRAAVSGFLTDLVATPPLDAQAAAGAPAPAAEAAMN